MKGKNILLVIASVAVMALVLVGCGGKKVASGGNNTSGNSQNAGQTQGTVTTQTKSGDSNGGTTVNVVPIDAGAEGTYVVFLLDDDVRLLTSDVTSNSGDITVVQNTSSDIDTNGQVGTPGKRWWRWSVHFASTMGSVTITIHKGGYTFVPSTLSF